MAMLIMASPSPGMGESANNFTHKGKQFAYNMQWHNAEAMPALGRPLQLYDTRFSFQKYEVLLVPPGTYYMNSMMAAQTNVDPVKPGKKQSPALGIGTVDFFQSQVYETVTSSRWREPTFEQRSSNRFVCQYVIGGSNQCVSGAYVRDSQTVMTDAGGYSQQIGIGSKDALGVRVRLQQPFASVTLKAGEVVLTDGVYAQLPNVGFTNSSCLPTKEKTLRCELESFEASTLPAESQKFTKTHWRMSVSSMGKLLKEEVLWDESDLCGFNARGGMMGCTMAYMSDVWLSPNMLAVLRRAQYQPLTMAGTLDTKMTPHFGGKNYVLQVTPKAGKSAKP